MSKLIDALNRVQSLKDEDPIVNIKFFRSHQQYSLITQVPVL